MTDTCTCPPGDCHGGHTTQIGPAARLTDEQIVDLVQRWKAGESVNASRPEVNSMAAELLAARARITELEAADREHSQFDVYLKFAHGIDVDREDAEFREWQEQYGA